MERFSITIRQYRYLKDTREGAVEQIGVTSKSVFRTRNEKTSETATILQGATQQKTTRDQWVSSSFHQNKKLGIDFHRLSVGSQITLGKDGKEKFRSQNVTQ